METFAIIAVAALVVFLLYVMIRPDNRHNRSLKKDIRYNRDDIVRTRIHGERDDFTASGQRETHEDVAYRTRKN